jgi:hypothetical protein
MPRSGAEVVGVEFGGGTDLGRGDGRWMERDRDRRRPIRSITVCIKVEKL